MAAALKLPKERKTLSTACLDISTSESVHATSSSSFVFPDELSVFPGRFSLSLSRILFCQVHKRIFPSPATFPTGFCNAFSERTYNFLERIPPASKSDKNRSEIKRKDESGGKRLLSSTCLHFSDRDNASQISCQHSNLTFC